MAIIPAAAMLSDDEQARTVAAVRPGIGHTPTGRLRDEDRDALDEVVRPEHVERWDQWRADALAVLEANIADGAYADRPPHLPQLQKRLSQVRWMRVRRGWYEHPELLLVVSEDEDPAGLL